ncbi:hypothetical protein ACE4Z5_27920, partial [Salmonella enterica]|uniref:hypothetical protein n=1 Tax=Salmonella enterica TaxID=28901 RepID=UPI003D2C196F
MSANAEETAAQGNVVAAASEEVNKNVQSVVAAIEEMNATIREIARNATTATEVGNTAMAEADLTNSSITKLGESSEQIGA